ncbi:MAG: hypothetical protein RL368_2545 [Pseudomonadota bacterium]|jgi:uncharacterized protein (DUF4213/DUF364 family)
MAHPREIYDLLLDKTRSPEIIQEILIGLTWTLARVGDSVGLAMSPHSQTRTLPWSGTLVGKSLADFTPWIRSWNSYESVVAMAAINAKLNQNNADLVAQSIALDTPQFANLAVFEHFLPHLLGKKVVIVGRYPHLEQYAKQFNFHVLERNPTGDDLPDPACEYLLPEAEWVFLTASSIPNKTFPRLVELSQNAHIVLIGPTAPWLTELADFGIEFLAAVDIATPDKLRQTVAEGGGVRIFENGARYHIFDLKQGELITLKQSIAEVAQRRQYLKDKIETWSKNPKGRCPYLTELDGVDKELSELDSRYKHLWDARHGRPAVLQSS